MSSYEQQRFKQYLLRDKEWLEELYTATNILQAKRLLNFAADTKLDTLIKYLHFISNGVIKIKRANFESIKPSHVNSVKKNFESKASLNRQLQSSREVKIKTLQKLAPSFPHLLYPLFNQQ
jgi:thiaminase